MALSNSTSFWFSFSSIFERKNACRKAETFTECLFANTLKILFRLYWSFWTGCHCKVFSGNDSSTWTLQPGNLPTFIVDLSYFLDDCLNSRKCRIRNTPTAGYYVTNHNESEMVAFIRKHCIHAMLIVLLLSKQEK